VAKNKAKNLLARNQTFSKKIEPQLKRLSPGNEEINIDLSEKNITDSQLQMLFAICNPSISVEAQIGLALRILCGFGIEEIANAFLTNKETINKRLYRAKEKLQHEKVQIEFPSEAEISNRLETVLTTLYLLFNEGYYSESQDAVLREDFCIEAMRLAYLLIENEQTNKPDVNALLALMCFHASRFPQEKMKMASLYCITSRTKVFGIRADNKGHIFSEQSIAGKCYFKVSFGSKYCLLAYY
jgi:RNA polymerase sigma-70 factor (ECF subfamily)